MASAGHKAYILAYCLANMASTCLPAVAFQIPIDPFETKQSRSQGPQFANVQEWIQASITAARRDEGPDALTFAHESLGLVALLAQRVATFSPFPPKRIVLTEADLRGPLVVKPG